MLFDQLQFENNAFKRVSKKYKSIDLSDLRHLQSIITGLIWLNIPSCAILCANGLIYSVYLLKAAYAPHSKRLLELRSNPELISASRREA